MGKKHVRVTHLWCSVSDLRLRLYLMHSAMTCASPDVMPNMFQRNFIPQSLTCGAPCCTCVTKLHGRRSTTGGGRKDGARAPFSWPPHLVAHAELFQLWEAFHEGADIQVVLHRLAEERTHF